MSAMKIRSFLGTNRGAKKTKGSKQSAKLEKDVPKKSFLSTFTDALDFSEARSKSDAWLLYEAKTKDLKGGRLSQEQAAALKRKIIGTKKDYWKDWVDVKGEYTDKGYVSTESSNVYGAPLIALTLLGVVSTLGLLVSQNS